ncbi:ATP-dependent helicase [Tropicibacter sp. R15_0]|uniref:UvrD-helicase domain-containing protein n=1 Tax=Tropicibacter sp. R15_0 TaxID=2821101 RepID=UPI001ADA6D62|nr:UvrD-helicase domain-containing protein [Tropicibacter sp. R15_0]MBO9467079.1 ATP-dependent helicase [Tropicibacter sp. R15_0]
MASKKLEPLDEILTNIENHKNFVLQGGAGSGKTETLKRVVQSVTQGLAPKRVVCITHTNKAADEIAERVSGKVEVSTIHAFLGALIRPYTANIKAVLPELFTLPHFERLGDKEEGETSKDKALSEHNRFKKAHEKLESRRRTVQDLKTDKVVGKRDYDKNPDLYVSAHNTLIDEINSKIKEEIQLVDVSSIEYNETPFNRFRDPSFGHDGLIEIASMLIQRHQNLRKILSDKFDCIFIDEYQDTHPEVVKSLVQASSDSSLCLGLFGDSEQAIYSEGIGDVEGYIANKDFTLVPKQDNYRCSPQVIEVANSFRCDGLKQEVALKLLADGNFETASSREGSAKLYFAMAPEKVSLAGENKTDTNSRYKADCAELRDKLVDAVVEKHPDFTQLKLTNKSIASDVGFGTLWEIFDANYQSPREEINRTLKRLQFEQLIEIVRLHQALPGDRRSYNRLIGIINRSGTKIRTTADKSKISGDLAQLRDPSVTAYEAIKFAIDRGFISQSDSHRAFLLRAQEFLKSYEADNRAKAFQQLYDGGANTKNRMIKELGIAPQDHLDKDFLEDNFHSMKRKLEKHIFLTRLFSSDLKMSDVLAFYEYEETDGIFATMHKTKGTGIENVLVVCDEYGWVSEYDFASCFTGLEPKSKREVQSRKLLYVACSRTVSNLTFVRLVKNDDELEYLKSVFDSFEEVALEE